jgi:hypothetical protein
LDDLSSRGAVPWTEVIPTIEESQLTEALEDEFANIPRQAFGAMTGRTEDFEIIGGFVAETAIGAMMDFEHPAAAAPFAAIIRPPDRLSANRPPFRRVEIIEIVA